ncbi:thioesterase [Rhodobacteraceae bacterium RKSG542]|uniref:thioesterase family protein n=1 Tax=Pseudovibrio flavus TaxID=2529854 RepID=UPI0012BC0C3C|nr:thioesterase family protein [Pseudovibrio flavus]MTI19123.1 thioesterase [Pseudovibrio flavus]
MRLWFRLILFLLITPFRKKLESPTGPSILKYRVHLTDIDTNVHLNNGQYLTFMDLGRLDLLARTGLWRPVLKHKWMPVVSGAAIRFRRELRLFEPFILESNMVYWNDETAVMEQRFRFIKGKRSGAIAATALVRVGLYDRSQRQFVPMSRLMEETGHFVPQPELKEHIRAFLESEEQIKYHDRQDPSAQTASAA